MKLFPEILRLRSKQEGEDEAVARDLREPEISDGQMENVLDSYGEGLIRLAYLYVKDWQAAEDIVQETFLAFYQKSHQFENRSSLKTYLSKIAINKCHDHLRSWKNKRALFTDALLKDQVNSSEWEGFQDEQA